MSKAARSVAGLKIDIDAKSVAPASRDLEGFNVATVLTTRNLRGLAASLAPTRAAALAAGAALTGMAAALGAASAAALVQERAERRLQGALERSGRDYGDVTRELAAYAAAQQASTRIGDDATLSSLAMLSDMTAGLETSIQHLMGWQALAADVAEATGKSIEESTRLVAKAAGGNTEAIGELIPGMRNQAQAANSMMDANERAAFALDALSASFGGAARNIGVVDLSLARIRNGFGDAVEGAGALVNGNERLQAAFVGVANSVDAAAGAFSQGTALGQLFGDTVGTFAEFGARQLQALTAGAIRATHALGEVVAIIGGTEADAANEKITAASRAMGVFAQASDRAAVAAGTSRVDSRQLRRELEALTEQGLLAAESARAIADNYAAGGSRTEFARGQLVALNAELERQIDTQRRVVGAESEAFAQRRANMLALVELAQRPTAPDAPEAPAVQAARVLAVEREATAVAAVETQSHADSLRRQREFNAAMVALFDEHANQVRSKKEAETAIVVAAQEARDAKIFELEAYRIQLMEQQAAKEQAALERRQEIGVNSATRLAGLLMSIEGKTAKERNKALRRALGGELVTEGGALFAKGVANSIALNPRGPLQVAGGAAMMASGKALGGAGGGASAGGASVAPRSAVEDRGPQRAERTEINNTTNISFGSGIPARARERAVRDGQTFVGLEVA